MIRLTRVIDYEYESLADMAKDIPNWMLPDRQWFPFGGAHGGAKRARSRVGDISWGDDETLTHARVSDVLADALDKTPRRRGQSRRGEQ